jgi:hypothetical protein
MLVVVGYKYSGMTEGTVVLYGIGFQPSGARGIPFANLCSLQTYHSDVSVSQENVYFVTICPHTYNKYDSSSATLIYPCCFIGLMVRTVGILT